jgi:hypothetical protein
LKTKQSFIELGKKIITKDTKTVNMLGCHDGIPVLDLKGKDVMDEGRNENGTKTPTITFNTVLSG